MSFFENLAFVMGGQDKIPETFRSSFNEYDQSTRAVYANPSQAMMPVQTSAVQSVTPVGDAGGVVRGGIFGRNSMPFTSGFTEAGASTITEGQGGGLYGGNITYNPSSSAYSNINPANYLYDKKKGASNLSAAVQRAQYQDYLNRFAPVENYLVNSLDGRNTKDLGYDLARANQSVISAGQNMQGQQERAMGRFGLQYRGPSIADSNEITGGRVAALNQARMADEERALSLMSGSGRTAGGQ